MLAGARCRVVATGEKAAVRGTVPAGVCVASEPSVPGLTPPVSAAPWEPGEPVSLRALGSVLEFSARKPAL